MKRFDGIRRAFARPSERPDDVRRDVDDELAFHLAMRETRLRARGLQPGDAEAEARRRFGDIDAVRTACVAEDVAILRSATLGERVSDFTRDLRIAVRSLWRSPGFAVSAALLLALGIGGTTSVFSIVNAVYFRPLPYPDADRLSLARASFADPMCDRRCARSLSGAEVMQWRERAQSIEAVGTIGLRQGPVALPSGSIVLEGAAVSRELPGLLGFEAALGRTLLPADFADGAPAVLVLSHSAWQSDFGGDSSVVGQTATIDSASYRIVGVLSPRSELGPPIFSFNVRTAQYVVPDASSPSNVNQVVVRLRRGIGVPAAESELAALLRNATGADWQATIEPLRAALADRYRGSFTLLLAASAVVLLLTCMNVGGLFVARMNDRTPELATRAVLGASRLQLIQQVLMETLVIASAGAVGGLALGFYGTRAARLIPADRLPFWTPIVMDVRVASLAVALAFVCALVVGVAPVVRLSPA
ncbi:MAG: ABC transporter permease, partial [Gemmatimonadaceae bacterium]